MSRELVNAICRTFPGAEVSDPWGGGHDVPVEEPSTASEADIDTTLSRAPVTQLDEVVGLLSRYLS
jgi:hypothetical protein